MADLAFLQEDDADAGSVEQRLLFFRGARQFSRALGDIRFEMLAVMVELDLAAPALADIARDSTTKRGGSPGAPRLRATESSNQCSPLASGSRITRP